MKVVQAEEERVVCRVRWLWVVVLAVAVLCESADGRIVFRRGVIRRFLRNVLIGERHDRDHTRHSPNDFPERYTDESHPILPPPPDSHRDFRGPLTRPRGISEFGARKAFAGLDFDYQFAHENPRSDQVLIRFRCPVFASTAFTLKQVELAFHDLKHSRKVFRESFPLTELGNGTCEVAVKGKKPSTVYAFTEFRFHTAQADLGTYKPPLHYYGVTAGTSAEDRARHQVATSALKEWHDWRSGRVRHWTHKPYARLGGLGYWCGDFYRWNGAKYLNMDYEGRSTEVRWFRRFGRVVNGSRTYARETHGAAVHGDFFTMAPGGGNGHRGMILGVDEDTGVTITVEGNYNNSVHVVRHSLDDFPAFGRIKDTMVRS